MQRPTAQGDRANETCPPLRKLRRTHFLAAPRASLRSNPERVRRERASQAATIYVSSETGRGGLCATPTAHHSRPSIRPPNRASHLFSSPASSSVSSRSPFASHLVPVSLLTCSHSSSRSSSLHPDLAAVAMEVGYLFLCFSRILKPRVCNDNTYSSVYTVLVHTIPTTSGDMYSYQNPCVPNSSIPYFSLTVNMYEICK